MVTFGMARSSQDREDLLRDATAYVSRVLLNVCSGECSTPAFVGFRSLGAASFFFDQDPVYHFNNSGQLRRAFVENQIFRAENGRLVAMRRQRGKIEVAMLRQELTAELQQEFCREVVIRLGALLQALINGEFTIEGQITATREENVVERVKSYLIQFQDIEVAVSAGVND